MNYIQSILLGIIQGLTEFLPVSSSGHLVLFQKIMNISYEGSQALTFDIALHLATLTAVIYIFKDDIWQMIKKPFSKFSMLILASTITTIIVAMILKNVIESAFETASTLGLEFLLTGAILVFAETMSGGKKKLEKTTYADAGIIGIAQGISALPAISRSGITLAAALIRGIDRGFAIKLCFIMLIPSIIGATILDSYKLITESGVISIFEIGLLQIIFGMIAAGISGYFAIKIMIRIFSRVKLWAFSIYLFIIGLLVILDQNVFNIFF